MKLTFRHVGVRFSCLVRCVFFGLALGALSACQNTNNEPETDRSGDRAGHNNAPVIPPALVTLNNRGVAEMGRFEYAKAEKTFAELLQQRPDNRLFQLNHLIALLNRQHEGDEEKALQLAEGLAKRDSDEIQARYIAGLLHLNAGRCDAALPHFEQVVQADPNDAYALYFSGQCLLQQGQPDAALARFQQAVRADGYLRSAYYSAFMTAQQLGQLPLAEKMLADYQKLQANPQSRLAEIKYTRMGPKAEVKTIIHGAPSGAQPNKQPLKAPFFTEPATLFAKSVQPAITANLVDLQHNGQTGLATLRPNGVYLRPLPAANVSRPTSHSGSSRAERLIQLPDTSGFRAMAWGDVDNDGQLDVVLAGASSQLWRNQQGQFTLAGDDKFGLGGPAWRNVRLADADHDGDLDILAVTMAGGFELWNNNLDGSWRVLNAEKAIPELSQVEQILLADVDADRDVDIILRQRDGISWLRNDRMWHYRLHTLKLDKPPVSLAVADLDNDGIPDWLISHDKGMSHWAWNPAEKRLQPIERFRRLNATPRMLAAVDISGDGSKDVLLFFSDEIRVLASPTGEPLEKHTLDGFSATFPPLIWRTQQGPELLFYTGSHWMRLGATANRAPFALLAFTGAEDKANSVRSNKSGIGVKYTVFAGDCASTGTTWFNGLGTGQNYQAVSAACGAKQLDFIAIEWPDGVYQTEQNLPTGRYVRIAETQRQLSSCPVIFLKRDGEYQFESDVLGVGGMGFAIGKDLYAEPRPWENYLVPGHRWTADESGYSLLFTEPMEEAAYLDSVQVEVLDVPPGWQVLLDERMQTGLPEVTGEPVFYRQRINPSTITRQDGADVTAAGLYADNHAIEPAALDKRFMGFADGEQTLTLRFDHIPDGDWVLLMRGWVEYGYSQTGFAAWQAGLRWQPPSVDVWRNGRWQPVVAEAGYPAGMPRLASIPLGQAVSGAKKIRIRSNQELYLDELALVKRETPPAVDMHALPLVSARLFKPGFPQRTDGPQRRPDYDYSRRQPFWDTRYMQGNYSVLGNVKPLVEKTDNALAIIGPGEAIEMTFDNNLPELMPGWNRYFVMKFTGWAKDMDLMTKDGETLAPIPQQGPVDETAKALNQKYNVRYRHGR